MGEYWRHNDKKGITPNWFHSKKKTYGYVNRDEEKRRLYQEILCKIPEESQVYVDETGIDDNEEQVFAWGPKGERIYGLKKARRNQRLNIIASLNRRKIEAPFVFEGYCTREIFDAYAENVLAKTLIPGQTVVLDNASFHKSKKLQEIIEQAGCKLLYLPPYSPDFNPIEHHWWAIKNAIRKWLPKLDYDLEKCVDKVFGC